MLPTFVVIGAMKCGTTSLHQYLNAHPEIGMSSVKELNFFSRSEVWDRGVDWYKTQFPDAAIRGETSPNYTKSAGAAARSAARMAGLLPNAKLVMLVRDPLERAISHYRHSALRVGTSQRIHETLPNRNSSWVQRSLYARVLQPYLAQFGLERILVLATEELGANTADAMQRVYSFVGAAPFECAAFEHRHRVAETELPALPQGFRKELAALLGPDAERLRLLTGQDFSSWSI